MQQKWQEESMIWQSKRKEGNLITWKLRNWSSCKMIEGNKSDVWIRGTMYGLGEQCNNMWKICVRRIKVMDG